uniref:Uncharacterized protein n=1 Tax=Panagrolaimus sp. PS1159 TaxID=55785 RepID=A0AC35G8H9_9BILA
MANISTVNNLYFDQLLRIEPCNVNLWYQNLKNNVLILDHGRQIDLAIKKLSLTGQLFWRWHGFEDAISLLLQHVVECEIEELFLQNQNITKNEFLTLTKNVKYLNLYDVKIRDDDGLLLNVGDILGKVADQIVEFGYAGDHDELISFTKSNTTEIPILPKLQKLTLVDVKNNLKYNDFFEFVKKYQKIEYCFGFQLSDDHDSTVTQNILKSAILCYFKNAEVVREEDHAGFWWYWNFNKATVAEDKAPTLCV